jgi:hypothetical protein
LTQEELLKRNVAG